MQMGSTEDGLGFLLLTRWGGEDGGEGTAYVLQQYLLSSVPNQVRNSPSSLLNGACNRTRLQHRADTSQRATLTFARLEFQPDICEHPPMKLSQKGGGLSPLAAGSQVMF